jgi:hypothetical protein
MVDMDRMRKGYDEQQKGGDFVSFDPGETLLYIHPPCREGDEWEPTTGRNYIPITVHYGIGKNKGMAVSLDTEKNAILTHPWVKKLLKAKKVRITGDCPVAAALADGTLTDDDADEARPQTRFLWGVTVLKKRAKSSDPWNDVTPKPGVAFIGKQIFDGFMSMFFDHEDITDPKGAVLVRVKREGEKRTTKYSVVAEPGSVKKPFPLPKSLAAALSKAMEEGGDCDLFRIAANLVKGTAEVQAMLAGGKVDTDAEDFDADEEDEAPKGKKGKAVEKPKGGKKAPPPEDDDEDEEDEDLDDLDDEDDEEEAPPPKKGKAVEKPKGKKAPPPEDDDEDEEDEDLDDEDDEEEEAPKAKSKPAPAAKGKKAPPPEDEDEDEDEEDEDEDEEEEEAPKAKSKSKSAPPAKSKDAKKKPAAEDDDEDLEDLEAALDDLDDDEEETPPPKKKSKK